MNNKHLSGWNVNLISSIFLFIYILEYIVFCYISVGGNRLPFAFDIFVFLFITAIYFLKYRRDNILCFELFFLPVFFVGMFFYDIIDITFAGSGVGGALLNAVTDEFYVGKSRIVQMAGFLAFMIGCSIANKKCTGIEKESWRNISVNGHGVDYKSINVVLVVLLLFTIYIDYREGMFDTYFAYSEDISSEDKHTGYASLRSLCFAITIFEFSRLSMKRIKGFKSFLLECNKLYLLSVIGISLILLISGNRNEMLLVFLPPVIAYSLFIKKFKPKFILVGVVLGTLLFVVSGLTRHGDSGAISEAGIYDVTQDYSLVTVDCNFLVKYTDEKTPLYFKEFPLAVLSGIPVLGHRIIEWTGMSYNAQSTHITTENMASFSETGLGTSLIGDLYYNGKFLFVIVYMLFFGWMISKLHNRFNIEKKYNIYLLVIYLYMVSDGVYYIREQWDFPLKSLLYSSIIIFVLTNIFAEKRNKRIS